MPHVVSRHKLAGIEEAFKGAPMRVLLYVEPCSWMLIL
jgi:hypothetical protein